MYQDYQSIEFITLIKMPPRKVVNPVSLQDLALSAFVELIYDSCRKIEKQYRFSLSSDMEDDTSACWREVESLQGHLLRFVPPRMLRTIFPRVVEKLRKTLAPDERIVFSVFKNEKINLNSLTIGYGEENSIWLIRHGVLMLTLLVELDLSNVQCHLITEICCNCPQLEDVTLPTDVSPEIMEIVAKNCRKLRRVTSLVYNRRDEMTTVVLEQLEDLEYVSWCIDGDVWRTLDPDRKLKLHTVFLYIHLGDPDSFQVAVNLCPDIKDLSIVLQKSLSHQPSSEILHILAASPLKLSQLTLDFFQIKTDVLVDFCSCKGIFLNALTLNLCDLISPLQFLRDISANCPNLIKLHVQFTCESASGDGVSGLATIEGLSFPRLEEMTIVDYNTEGIHGLVLAHHCVSTAEKLTMLSFDTRSSTRLDDLLTSLFSLDRAKQLTSVRIWCAYQDMSVQVAKHIVDNCRQITRLELGRLTPDAKLFLEEV